MNIYVSNNGFHRIAYRNSTSETEAVDISEKQSADCRGRKSVELKGLYHRRVFAVCLQSEPQSYEWGLSVRSVYLK